MSPAATGGAHAARGEQDLDQSFSWEAARVDDNEEQVCVVYVDAVERLDPGALEAIVVPDRLLSGAPVDNVFALVDGLDASREWGVQAKVDR